MKHLILSLAIVMSLSASAHASDKTEIWCARPGGYDLSIHVRNSASQGGAADNSLFVFLNGGYLATAEISAISNAFGKGDATFLYANEKAWDQCEATETTLHCELKQTETPIRLLGRRGFDGPIETIVALSSLTLDFAKQDSGDGAFEFTLVEAGSGIREAFEFDLPCR